ncbi:hypothetical protein ACQKNS_01335 [Peribacillus sp. NPDC094092]|uniref:hypothetical protein n=1 Tax=Peribacillus sp. NPDC094092 TaxID=3390611 RepID=UPI003D022C36
MAIFKKEKPKKQFGYKKQKKMAHRNGFGFWRIKSGILLNRLKKSIAEIGANRSNINQGFVTFIQEIGNAAEKVSRLPK